MAKYEPLEAHLRRQKTDSYEMSFRDIERILTVLLPKSAQRPEWWGNETGPPSWHIQCKAWLAAGFHAVPQVTQERVRFERRRA
ncbi:MAG TPA: hypothetical protein VGG92_04175 [Caulobacteraceae bacterium]|jgi:hypothetical protein